MTAQFFTPDTLLKKMEAMNIPFHLHHHRAVFSVADGDDVDAKIPGFHTRNMFLRDKKEKMFLITLGQRDPIDLKKLESVLNCGRLSFGSPQRLMKYLGVTPGSVTPLAILNDINHEVTQILDARMMMQDVINMHPLINTMTVGLTAPDLLKVIDRAPTVIDLSAAAPSP